MSEFFIKIFSIYYVFGAYFQNSFILVTCDLSIVNICRNSVEFKTASDFVRTGCGSILEPSFLVISNPLDACTVPYGPPSKLELPSSCNETWEGDSNNFSLEKTQWVLLALELESGNCDLKTKFRNAASAGYSGIIVTTSELHEEILYPGLLSEDDEEFLDVHLVNPADIKWLAKYAYPELYAVNPPQFHKCKEEYNQLWVRSRYASLAIRSWKKISIYLKNSWESFSSTFLRHTVEWVSAFHHWAMTSWRNISSFCSWIASIFFNDATDNLVDNVKGVLGTFCALAIALYLIFGLMVIFVLTPFTIVLQVVKTGLEFLMKLPAWKRMGLKCNFNWMICLIDKYTVIYNKLWEFALKFFSPAFADTNDFSSSEQREGTSPPPSPPRVSIDPTVYHRINLGYPSSQPLRKDLVSKIFKEMALKCHPDKNSHLDLKEREKITEVFKSKKKSRDALLAECRY